MKILQQEIYTVNDIRSLCKRESKHPDRYTYVCASKCEEALDEFCQGMAVLTDDALLTDRRYLPIAEFIARVESFTDTLPTDPDTRAARVARAFKEMTDKEISVAEVHLLDLLSRHAGT